MAASEVVLPSTSLMLPLWRRGCATPVDTVSSTTSGFQLLLHDMLLPDYWIQASPSHTVSLTDHYAVGRQAVGLQDAHELMCLGFAARHLIASCTCSLYRGDSRCYQVPGKSTTSTQQRRYLSLRNYAWALFSSLATYNLPRRLVNTFEL